MYKYLIITAITMVSCNSDKGKIESKIIADIEKCENASDCIINLGEYTDFEWDKVCVFWYNATPDEIYNALGQGIKVKEFHNKIVFTLEGRVVYLEERKVDFDGLYDCIVFETIENNPTICFDINNARFVVESNQSSKGTYYVLTNLSMIP